MKIKSPEESTKKAIEIKSLEESMEIKGPKEDENTTDWYDKNKLRKISTIVNSNKFNHKTKIGKFKYTDIKNMVDNINKNTISVKLPRKNLNALNELKNAKIKNKCLSSNQTEILKLFDDLLETISNNNYNNNNNNSNNNNGNNNENEKESESENENDNDNVNESESNNENDNDNVNDDNNNNNENENYDDYEIKKKKVISK